MVALIAITLILPLAAYVGVLWLIQSRFSSHAKDLTAAAVGILSIAALAHEVTLPPEMGNGAAYAFLAVVLTASFGILSVIVLIASLHRRKI